jgi:general secretion pathway protein N
MTMSWLRRYPLIVALGAVAVLLLVAVALEAAFGPGRTASSLAAATPTAAADSKLLPPIAATNPEQAYPETAERPLFTPTRRRAPEAPQAAQNTFTPGQFTLQGVIIVGDNRVAMLREKSTGRIIRVERGREVNGIKVAEIEPERVRLELGAQNETIPLVVQKGPAGAPPQPASGPFPTTTAGPVQGAAPPQAPPQAAPGFPVPPGTPAQAAGGPMSMLQGANPGPAALPQATPSAPLTPEELLARRRARRAQPNQ